MKNNNDYMQCERCGHYYKMELLSEYKGRLLCPGCEDKLRTKDAQKKLRPDFKNLFNAIAACYY